MLTLPHAIAAIFCSFSIMAIVASFVFAVAADGWGDNRDRWVLLAKVFAVGGAILFATATIVHFLALVR